MVLQGAYADWLVNTKLNTQVTLRGTVTSSTRLLEENAIEKY